MLSCNLVCKMVSKLCSAWLILLVLSFSRLTLLHSGCLCIAVQWKPKLNQKSSVNNPGVIGKPSQALTNTSEDLEKEGSQLQDKMSRLNISDNVIIAEHIRVSETDRCRLTFGSFGAELKSAKDLDEESQTESSRLVMHKSY